MKIKVKQLKRIINEVMSEKKRLVEADAVAGITDLDDNQTYQVEIETSTQGAGYPDSHDTLTLRFGSSFVITMEADDWWSLEEIVNNALSAVGE